MKLFRNLLRETISFSKSERKAVLLILCVAVGIVTTALLVDRKAIVYNSGFARDPEIDTLVNPPQRSHAVRSYFRNTTHRYPASTRTRTIRSAASCFYFDPNTASLQDFERLGFSPKQAQVILNYRNKGARFRKPEDFSRCYTVSPEMFERLRPYLRIAPEFARQTAPTGISTPASGHYVQNSENQFHSHHDFPVPTTEKQIQNGRTNYPHDTNDTIRQWRPKAPITCPIDLNQADTTELMRLRGIGPVLSARIVAYRERLGGFASTDQLREVWGLPDTLLEKASNYFFVHLHDIQKISINFADAKLLSRHPYLPKYLVNRILKNRELKGGWSSITAMIEQHILHPREAQKLAPYLHFEAPISAYSKQKNDADSLKNAR